MVTGFLFGVLPFVFSICANILQVTVAVVGVVDSTNIVESLAVREYLEIGRVGDHGGAVGRRIRPDAARVAHMGDREVRPLAVGEPIRGFAWQCDPAPRLLVPVTRSDGQVAGKVGRMWPTVCYAGAAEARDDWLGVRGGCF